MVVRPGLASAPTAHTVFRRNMSTLFFENRNNTTCLFRFMQDHWYVTSTFSTLDIFYTDNCLKSRHRHLPSNISSLRFEIARLREEVKT